ncbi:hypothetical protein [Desulfurispira natronophila]|uniref:Putative membrane protein n=1 Tax=Desulfurispira natronophila TaxID=682562 RepID=A0A7W7Y4D5_9BACT|nr:hypothetical protein [Desulfurispira natronophila]MBB5021818.1 putative membrane protein [Desulfurispira natronophila]
MGLFELGGYILFVLMLTFTVFIVYIKDKKITEYRNDRNRYVAERNEAVEYANKLSQQVDMDFSKQEERVERFKREQEILLELCRGIMSEEQYTTLEGSFQQRVKKLNPRRGGY